MMPPTVLIVDDEQPLTDVIRLLMEDLGHRAVTAANGVEALEIARREKPDLVISDIMMPLMPGDELCRRLKREVDDGLKVVLMSAAGARRAEGTGADAFVNKPFDLETVEDVVRRLLDD